MEYEFEKEEKLKNAMAQEFDTEEFWKMKLPQDSEDIIKRLNPLAVYNTKKELFSLLHKGILFDDREWVNLQSISLIIHMMYLSYIVFLKY